MTLPYKSIVFGLLVTQISCISADKKTLLSASICDTSSVKYSTTITPILNTYCISCHSAASPSAGINLEGYNNVKNYVDNGQLWGTMNHSSGYSPMPKGATKIDACKLSQLLAWINLGAPNN